MLERGVNPPAGGQNPDQNQGEPNLKPKWIELHREMFPEGSIGFLLFPEILEGRKRPETIFNQPLRVGIKTKIPKELQNESFVTISDILYLPEAKLSQFKRPDEIKDYTSSLLSNLAITPHAKLLGAIFNEPQFPVPKEREQEQISAAQQLLDSLTIRGAYVLTLRFGINDGIIHPLKEIGKELNVGEERVRQIEKENLLKLRHPSRSKEARQYLSLPTDSFGREIFSAVFGKDLPQLDIPVRELFFSDSVKSELRDLFPDRINAGDLAKIDLEKHALSPLAQAEIKEMLEVSKIAAASPTEVEIFVPDEKSLNKLLSKFSISEEQLNLIAKLPIEKLNLNTLSHNTLKRYRVKTIGDLLLTPFEDLLAIRMIGSVSASHIKEKLLAFINPLFQSESVDFTLLKYRESPESVLRRVIDRIINQGHTSPKEIQDFLIGQKQDVFGIAPTDWKVTAMIEYILNHPEES